MKKQISSFFLKALVIIALIAIWTVLSHFQIWNPLLFPGPSKTVTYIFENQRFVYESTLKTLRMLVVAFCICSFISFSVGSIASQWDTFRRVLEVLVSIINPIPSISLLPFAMLWFGLGDPPILFTTVMGSLAVFTLSIMNGFTSISPVLVDVGRIYGLGKWGMLRRIYLLGALPSILTGVRATWGISWRSLVGAELVCGAMGESRGLGWLITINRYNLNPNGMFAGILCITAIGLLIEHGIIGLIEKKTVKKWGMRV